MNGTRVLLDTNILLGIFNGDRTLAAYLEENDLFISFISEMEVLGYHGFSSTERKKMASLIQSIPVIEMNAVIKEIAIKIRQHHRIKLPDSIVAATAMYLKSACITGDSGFKQIKDLDLIFYSS